MMDLQKEREAFEAWLFKYYPKSELVVVYRPNENLYEHRQTQIRWIVWQAAKAKAVPDGFVVVPMVPTRRMIKAVRQCYEGEAYLPYSLYSEFVNQAIIERMEAQEQAND